MKMTTKHTARAALAGFFAISLLACTDLKSGDDRANDEDAAVTTDGGAGMSGQSGMSGTGGESGDGSGGVGGMGDVQPVSPTVTRFSTLGQPRQGEGVSLRDDGFEFGGRRCTANGSLCVTGGFEP